MKILVYQGEREMAKDNRCLGTFTLEGIPPAPRGVPKLKVIFEVDANGILNVTARDQDTGKERSISITGSSTLSKEEVDRMLKDAEENAAAERLKQEQVDLHNQVDRLLYQAEKQLANWGDKLPAAEKENVERLTNELKKALESKDLNRIRSLTNQGQQALLVAAEVVYRR